MATSEIECRISNSSGKVRLVLNDDINVNATDKEGWTPLMFTAAWNDKAGVKFLVKKGASFEHKNNDGNTALMIAAIEENIEIVKLFNQIMEAQNGKT